MSDPKEIREAVSRTDHWHLDAITDAALAYADSLEDPIWWCFEHGVSVPDGNFEMCAHFEWQLAMGRTIAPCDIAEATRPRRIQ